VSNFIFVKMHFRLKKLLHLLIAAILVVSTTGFTITKHYCNGEYVSMVLNSTPESCCGSSDCCNNESEIYRLKQDFTFIQVTDFDFIPAIDIEIVCLKLFVLSHPDNNISVYLKKGFIPPPDLSAKLAVLQSFLL
jgi:hypothetical protein